MQRGVAGTGRVKGKVALVTGAASGIGRATALLLVREGARVAVTDIDEPEAQRVANAITENGGESISTKLNVTSESDWKAALSVTQARWGPVNVLVAGAGISFAKPVTEMSLEEWRRFMEVNLDGVFLGTKHAVGQMREGSGGSIVIVSSASGIKASPGASAYCASKAALRLFAKSVALECAENGDAVRVNTVHPVGASRRRCGVPWISSKNSLPSTEARKRLFVPWRMTPSRPNDSPSPRKSRRRSCFWPLTNHRS